MHECVMKLTLRSCRRLRCSARRVSALRTLATVRGCVATVVPPGSCVGGWVGGGGV